MSPRLRSRSVSLRVLGSAVLAAMVAACGGGGGGGGGGGTGPGPDPAANVNFTGFTFRVGSGTPTASVPLEDLNKVPPTLGAPLDVTLIFNFDGVPQGPFNQQNLPVFTTPADVTPAAGASVGTPVIAAKGTYVPVGDTVEFRPFVPTAPLQVALAAPPDAVPGLLPGSTYTAKVVATPGLKIPNLKGAGGQVKFDTTSLPGAYFTGGSSDGLAPRVVATVPADGTTGISPGPFSTFAPGSPLPSFPAEDPEFTLTFDHAISPSTENLEGKDWDGDGYLEPNFFVRAQATRLLVGLTVPAGSTIGNGAPYPALSGLMANQSVLPNGSDIFLYGPGALPGADAGLSLTPSSLAVARDPDLLYVVLRVDGGTDRLSVVDHVLGDPRAADIAAASQDTGLEDLHGLVTLQSGRLIAWDASTRRLYELLPSVVRNRPLGEPVITALTVGDGETGFLSDVFPAGVDVLDLAQSPTGDLYALTTPGGGLPQVQLLAPVDPDLNGAFVAGEGLPLGPAALSLTDEYGAIAFIDAQTIYGLNRGTDAVDELTLAGGFVATVVQGVAAYGVPLAGLPDGLSPALDLEIGFMSSELSVAVVSNDATGAVVRLEPRGILPIGERVDVMQRYALASTSGVALSNEDPAAPKSVLGAELVLSVTTSDPLNTVGPCGVEDPANRVNDVLDETFADKTLEDTTPTGLSPLAEWAETVSGGTSSGHLRASVGADNDPPLGDFSPVANANYDPTKAYPAVPSDANAKAANFKYVFLDTDVQNFPLPNGETPNVTENLTVFGGDFQFHDFIIPAGVWVRVKGSHPLRIAATGKVEIGGVLDLSGSNGQDDITFDSAFIPVGGGAGGPGAGRGGDGHPTVFPPNVVASINGIFVAPYATPESGEQGFGAALTPTGGLVTGQVGGRGGLSTLGYDPDANGYVQLNQAGANKEFHRPPGGGGGSYYFHGMRAHQATGTYLVQSSSSFGNFTKCPTNDKINDSLYGLEEMQYCFAQVPNPLQCVYMLGTPSNPNRFLDPTLPGDLLFSDGNPDNDFLGGKGELQYLLGGQGGGGGGTRIDSLKQQLWGTYPFGLPTQPLPLGPPCYPNLFVGFFASPSVYDAKGGGGGGGGGTVLIRSLGNIRVTRTGHILAVGGTGGGGETVGNSNYSGGGGGGSGGAIILQAAGEIVVEADSDHQTPGATDTGGAEGAALEVSGGRGCDAVDNPVDTSKAPSPTGAGFGQFTRSDGGQGGFGMIQLQEGSGDGMPTVQQGAFLFAKQAAMIKRYKFADTLFVQWENPWFNNPNQSAGADFLRYIDEHYYRHFLYGGATEFSWFVLNGADPPIIQVSNPATIGTYQLDTAMIDYFGQRVVKEPEPAKILKTYNGFNANFKEIGTSGQLPGTTFLPTDVFPMSIWLKEPDGTPIKEIVDGVERFPLNNVIDRLPVIHPSKTPPEFGTVSRGTSKWLDFNGVALRVRDVNGLAPPLFPDGFNGTYNPLNEPPPPGKDGQVITANAVTGIPAHFVANTGIDPFGKKLCTDGPLPHPEFNDVKVDAPEFAVENALTDNATVTVQFQGALPIRSGSHVPDPDTLTEWTSDLSEVSGYPLVRFQVAFNVSKDPELYPFSINSMRPAVDRVRIRARY
jgi:hypothetical protein